MQAPPHIVKLVRVLTLVVHTRVKLHKHRLALNRLLARNKWGFSQITAINGWRIALFLLSPLGEGWLAFKNSEGDLLTPVLIGALASAIV